MPGAAALIALQSINAAQGLHGVGKWVSVVFLFLQTAIFAAGAFVMWYKNRK